MLFHSITCVFCFLGSDWIFLFWVWRCLLYVRRGYHTKGKIQTLGWLRKVWLIVGCSHFCTLKYISWLLIWLPLLSTVTIINLNEYANVSIYLTLGHKRKFLLWLVINSIMILTLLKKEKTYDMYHDLILTKIDKQVFLTNLIEILINLCVYSSNEAWDSFPCLSDLKNWNIIY